MTTGRSVLYTPCVLNQGLLDSYICSHYTVEPDKFRQAHYMEVPYMELQSVLFCIVVHISKLFVIIMEVSIIESVR